MKDDWMNACRLNTPHLNKKEKLQRIIDCVLFTGPLNFFQIVLLKINLIVSFCNVCCI